VIDGDIFGSGNAHIRLFGVDTAERGDRCFTEAIDRLEEFARDSVLESLGRARKTAMAESSITSTLRMKRVLMKSYSGKGCSRR
jgi:hypothetical protein